MPCGMKASNWPNHSHMEALRCNPDIGCWTCTSWIYKCNRSTVKMARARQLFKQASQGLTEKDWRKSKVRLPSSKPIWAPNWNLVSNKWQQWNKEVNKQLQKKKYSQLRDLGLTFWLLVCCLNGDFWKQLTLLFLFLPTQSAPTDVATRGHQGAAEPQKRLPSWAAGGRLSSTAGNCRRLLV